MQKIMFSDKYGLTKAVLEGRKTKTRRIIPKEFFTLQWDVRDDTLVVENECGDFIDIRNTKFCMFKVGEIVAVAQSYKTIDDYYKSAYSYNHSAHGMTICEFDGVSDKDVHKWNMIAVNYRGKKVWTNKLFVKPELMLHFIRITNVRIERLQDISNKDCLAEGIDIRGLIVSPTSMGVDKIMYHFCNINRFYSTPREAYAALIDKVGKKGDWDKNPFVFCYTFELIK